MTLYVQETLMGGESVGLYHDRCGRLFGRDLDWVIDNVGARIGCPWCGQIEKVPSLEAVGSEEA